MKRQECPGRAGLTEALPVGTVCPTASLPSQSSIPTKLSREMFQYVEGVRFTQAFLLPFPLQEFSPSHVLSQNWWGHSDCETCSSLSFGSSCSSVTRKGTCTSKIPSFMPHFLRKPDHKHSTPSLPLYNKTQSNNPSAEDHNPPPCTFPQV